MNIFKRKSFLNKKTIMDYPTTTTEMKSIIQLQKNEEKEIIYRDNLKNILNEDYETIDFLIENILKKESIVIERDDSSSYYIRYNKKENVGDNVTLRINSDYISMMYEFSGHNYNHDSVTIRDSYFFEKWEEVLENSVILHIKNKTCSAIKNILQITNLERSNKLNNLKKLL